MTPFNCPSCESENPGFAGKSRHSFCDIKAGKENAICNECGGKGKAVSEMTLKSLVREAVIETIENLIGFYFCETPTCSTVYFNNDQNVFLHKEDIKVRVGIKETESPIPVCYCFGWTQERIFDEIMRQGYSTAAEEISARVRSGECECGIKNPSGRCCLGAINKTTKQGMEFYKKMKEKDKN